MVLRVLLAQAELELVPDEIGGHPAIRKWAQTTNRKAAESLLDQNQHGHAMGKLADGKRRGRPDIVHNCLLSLLESPLCRAGRLEVAIHTRHGQLIHIRPDTRLPRGEARFQGVMARVLRGGSTHDKDPLIWIEGKRKPSAVLASFAKGPIVRLDESGGKATPLQVADLAEQGELTLVIGAYPEGPWSDAWCTAAPNTASIWPEPLTAWNVAAELMAAFRARHGPAWKD